MTSRRVEGERIVEGYRVVRLLGSGGMGEVYVAEQLATGRERALKLMHARLQDKPALRERFVQEARVVARIQSKHCVEVIDAGVEDDSGTPWIAMELLQGKSLGAAVRTEGPLSPARALSYLRQIAHAVGQAHAVGIIHRDLKPENIFVAHAQDAAGTKQIKVLDFGIAKSIKDASALGTGPLGSPAWMAPEQAEAGKPIAPGTDIWSLGLVTFWMLTGSSFWRSASHTNVSTHAFLKEILFDVLPAASERAKYLGCADRLPAGFDAWFERCVHRDERARFRDAGEMLRAFVPLVDSDATEAAAPPRKIEDTGNIDTVDFLASQRTEEAATAQPNKDAEEAAQIAHATTAMGHELNPPAGAVDPADLEGGPGLVAAGLALLIAAGVGLSMFWFRVETSANERGPAASAVASAPAGMPSVLARAEPSAHTTKESSGVACGHTRCSSSNGGICCWDNYLSARAKQGACSQGNIAGDNCATTDSAEMKRGYQTRIECQNSSQCQKGEVCCARLVSNGYKNKPYFQELFCSKKCTLPLRQMCDQKSDGGMCPRLPLGTGTIQAECKRSGLLPPGYLLCGYPTVR